MDFVGWIGLALSPLGIWKIAEMIIKLLAERKKVKAEIRSLDTASESQIIKNWVEWSAKMEGRVKELEEVRRENHGLKRQVAEQRKRIARLERRVDLLKRENEKLREQLGEQNNTIQL